MNLFELFVKIGVKDEASKNIGSLSDKLGNGLKTAAKIGTAAVSAASTAVVALTKQAVESYAEYEQLVGGVETLYGAKYKTIDEYIKATGASADLSLQEFEQYQNRQQSVLDNAANAYKTAGMSANDYMNTVNGFAASLTSSLGEYEWQAANYADMIVTDMSDNANKMGSDISSLQVAYQGFAKGNFTMLDNLKLGYGGTKEEMERLLRKAEEIEGYKVGSLDISSFADVAEAINIIQTDLGITGTTAREAATTIQGSLSTMKGAWSNLLTGMADEEADFDGLINNLVDSVGTFAENILPRIEIALGGVANLVTKLAPVIVKKLPELFDTILPSLLEGATNLVTAVVDVLPDLLKSVIDAISDNKDLMATSVVDIVTTLIDTALDMLPELIKLGLDLVIALAEGLTENADEIIVGVMECIGQIMDYITNPETITNLLKATIKLLVALGKGLVEAFPIYLQSLNVFWGNILSWLGSLFVPIGNWFKEVIPKVGEWLNGVFDKIGEFFSNAWNSVTEFFSNIWGDITGFFDEAGENTSTFFSDIWSNITDFFTGIWTDITGFFSTMWAGIQEFLDRPGYYIGYAIGFIWKQITTFFTETIPEAWERFKEWFFNGLNAIGDAITKFFTVTIPQKWENFKTWFFNGLTAIGESIKNFFTQTIPNAWNSFTTWLSEGFEKLSENVKTFFTETIPNAWAGLKDKAREIMENVTTTISEFFTVTIPKKWEEFKTNATNKINSIKDWFKNLPKTLSTIGTNIVEGLWEGLKKRWNKLKDDAKGLLDDFIKGFKDGLGIASPSKLFKLFGEYIDEGLSIGLLDNADSPISAIESVSDQLVSAFDPDLATEYMTTYDGYSSSSYGGSSSAYSSEEASSSVNITFGEKAFYIANFNGNSESEVDNFVDAVIDKLTSKIQSREAVFA